jgi:putative protease
MLSKLKRIFKTKKKAVNRNKRIYKKKSIKKDVTRKKQIKRKIKKEILTEELIGIITHYFPRVKAGVIKIKRGSVSIGDILHIKGHTTDFIQKVTSIEINHRPVKSASKGKEIGLLVKSRVRHNDKVYKIKK